MVGAVVARGHRGVVLGDQPPLDPGAAQCPPVLVQDAGAVLLAAGPVADLLAAVPPEELPEALLLVGDLVALLHAAVGPREHALPVDLVAPPLALEDAAVLPALLAAALDVVVAEVAVLETPVGPPEVAAAVFEPLALLARVLRAVAEDLDARAVLPVGGPPPLEVRLLGRVLVRAVPVCLVVDPFPVLLVAFFVFQSAYSVRSVVDPLSFLLRVIFPLDHSESLFAQIVVHQTGLYYFGIIENCFMVFIEIEC